MRLPLAVIAALPLLLCLATPGFAAGNLRQDLDQLQRLREAIDVEADHLQYNEAEKKLIARGMSTSRCRADPSSLTRCRRTWTIRPSWRRAT